MEKIGDVELQFTLSPIEDPRQIAILNDQFRTSHSNAISLIVSGTATNKPAVSIGLTDDLIRRGSKAPEIVRLITGGKGGGRDYFASGSVADQPLVESTFNKWKQLLGEYIKAK